MNANTVQEVRQDKRGTRSVTYQLELIRCGKERCRCRMGGGHGPYWFAYWKHVGKKRKRYIGVELKLLTFEQLRAFERDRWGVHAQKREAWEKAKRRTNGDR
jgi:Family of unknown function (DUF6788)